MDIGIGTEKTPVELGARIGKAVAFLRFATPLLVFAHHNSTTSTQRRPVGIEDAPVSASFRSGL